MPPTGDDIFQVRAPLRTTTTRQSQTSDFALGSAPAGESVCVSFLYRYTPYSRRVCLADRLSVCLSVCLFADKRRTMFQVQTRRHPQNRKYITYCIVRGGPSHSHSNTCSKFCEVWNVVFDICKRTNRRTDRQTDTDRQTRASQYFAKLVSFP